MNAAAVIRETPAAFEARMLAKFAAFDAAAARLSLAFARNTMLDAQRSALAIATAMVSA